MFHLPLTRLLPFSILLGRASLPLISRSTRNPAIFLRKYLSDQSSGDIICFLFHTQEYRGKEGQDNVDFAASQRSPMDSTEEANHYSFDAHEALISSFSVHLFLGAGPSRSSNPSDRTMRNPSDQRSSMSDLRPDPSEGAVRAPESPHEALFFTLAYLVLRDLFSVQKVCRSLRDSVNGDPLLWQDICVDWPLSWKLTNDALVGITAKAQGSLRSLTLKNCLMVTDDGLRRVIDENPRISELCLPGCIHVTGDGIVEAVRALADHTGASRLPLKRLALHGLNNLTAEHINKLNSMLKRGEQKAMHRMYRYYGHRHSVQQETSCCGVVDVDVCPRCSKVNPVFDCTREQCRYRFLGCRGCLLCIARCDDCGGCLRWDEFGQTFCLDLLCEECWLQLPKCMLCNRSGCRGNKSHSLLKTDSGLMCQVCYESTFAPYIDN